jgi:hypothetical protein
MDTIIRAPTRQIRELLLAWSLHQDIVLQLRASLLQIMRADFLMILAKNVVSFEDTFSKRGSVRLIICFSLILF